jgi:endo-1,4-beta-xylanase
MFSFIPSLALVLSAAVGTLASPVANPVPAVFIDTEDLVKRGGTQSSTGNDGGYYYSFWTDNQAYVLYDNEGGGQYRVRWSGNGDFTAGKGWQYGSYTRKINYNANYGVSSDAKSYLSVYGWTTNPLVEYYIVESWRGYNPSSGAQNKGTVYSDGSTYNLYESTRYNQPSIQGTATFNQYWSVRQNQRTSGSITTQNHFDAWGKAGMGIDASLLQDRARVPRVQGERLGWVGETQKRWTDPTKRLYFCDCCMRCVTRFA